jgi:hypothetical protein
MKKEPGKGMVIFGSGSIVSQLAQEGLIDEYQMVMNPIVLGKGRTMFDGIKEKLTLRMASSAFIPLLRKARMSLAYTGPQRTRKPHPFRTRWAATPVAESCGRMRSLCRTSFSRPVSFTLLTTSAVEKVFFPAAFTMRER